MSFPRKRTSQNLRLVPCEFLILWPPFPCPFGLVFFELEAEADRFREGVVRAFAPFLRALEDGPPCFGRLFDLLCGLEMRLEERGRLLDRGLHSVWAICLWPF